MNNAFNQKNSTSLIGEIATNIDIQSGVAGADHQGCHPSKKQDYRLKNSGGQLSTAEQNIGFVFCVCVSDCGLVVIVMVEPAIKKGSTANATLWNSACVDHSSGASALALRRAISTIARISSPALVPISSICASDASALPRFDINLFSSLSFNWRRSISPCMAATIKPALLSPFNFTPSMPSSTSCGMRAVTDWDFALVEPVAINQPSVNWCLTVYTKLNYTKELICKPLGFIFNYTLSTGKAQAPHKIAKPRSARTHAGPLTTSDRISIEAAMQNIITAPARFTFLFLAVVRVDPKASPHREQVTATTEHEARAMLAARFVLLFAGRMPVREVCHG